MTFGERIYKIRTSKGLTQEELANAVGYKSRSTIAKIESGERDAPQSMIIALAKALGTTPSYLMGWGDINKQIKELELTLEDDPQFMRLLTLYYSLNEIGKEKAVERIEELAEIERYAKKEGNNYGII